MKVNIDGEWVICPTSPIRRLRLDERLKRSLKTFAILFISALFSVLIPVLHLFLVPGLLFLSILLSVLKYKEVGTIDLTEFKCPSCHKLLNEKIKSFKANDITIRMYCLDCRKSISIFLAEDEA